MSVAIVFLPRAAQKFLDLPDRLKAEAEELLDQLRDELGRKLDVEGTFQYRRRVRFVCMVAEGRIVINDVSEVALDF